MICAVILAVFVAGISAQTCVPPDVVHTETGDALYQALLCDLNKAEMMAAQISATAQGACAKFENVGDFFTQLLITINADNTWLDKIGAGGSASGDECMGVNLRIDFDLKNIQGKANTPVASTVCPPTSGAALSQYTLQQFGKTLTALAAAPAGPATPGVYQKYVQDLNNGITAVRKVIADNNVAGCLAATQTIANALKGIRSSCGVPPPPPAYPASG